MVNDLVERTGLNKSVVLRAAVIAFLEKYSGDPKGVLELFAQQAASGRSALAPSSPEKEKAERPRRIARRIVASKSEPQKQ